MKLIFGMILKSNMEETFGEINVVEPYFINDTDPMAYKVKLGDQSYYSIDLMQLIREGLFEIIN
mgnify:CR=1 FL=1